MRTIASPRGKASSWPWLLGLGALLLGASPALPAPGDQVGRPAPECRLPGLGDAPGLSLGDFTGKVVYVDFWASWCEHCAPAFRFLNALEAEFGDAGLVVVGVNVDERREAARAFLDKHPAHFRIAWDPVGACPAAYALAAMPSAYVVDRAGVIRAVHVGFRAGQAAARREEIRRLIQAGAGAP